ncbi:MAG: histidinol-phosphate aminotransferase family protein [Candidatus Latescibacteria bacterium]|nr:histidinol-phosphate aminotransferase family protein [Candidatus Latescibacterota bacterium]
MKTALAGGMTAIASTGSWESAAAMLAVPVGRSVNGVGIDDPELVQLSINENPLGASPHAIEAVAHKMFSLNRYPPREPVLHEAIAKYHVNDGISIDMVATGVGSTEILKAIGMLAMIDGGNVIEPVPGYGAVSGVASTLGREPIRIPLTEDLQTDLNTVKDAVNSETRIVIFTNPNNPTGQLIPYTDLVAFLDSVPESVIVCVDEAYIHFVGDTSYRNMVGLTKTRKNLFVARTMSKAFGLGGMRVGYGIGHPELISRVRPHLLGWLGRSVLGDVASIAALGDRQHLQDVRTHVSREKEYLYQALTELGLKPVKTETIFVIADMGRNTEPFIQELAARKVLIRQAFGMDNYIRISTGTHTENEILIEVMKEVMSKGV